VRKKRRENLYNTDYNRISIYPSYKKPDARERITVGSVLTIRVSKTDENGDPLGEYRGYNVVILGDAMPGEVVRVKVDRVRGNTIWASIVRG